MTESEGIAERWSEYFEELLNVEGEEEHEEQEQEEQQQEVEMDEINIEEMKKELQFMKNGKAPGEDEIAIEIIKAGGPEIIEWLTEIFILACRNETTPEDWGLGIICPLFKKGNKGECANYRGVTLLSHIGKLFERILERRLRNIVEGKLGQWQHGFIKTGERNNRSDIHYENHLRKKVGME